MDTREHILDTAQALAQARGFNAFSYADIAASVGIRKASIHHHFPAKEDLEIALVQRYRERFSDALGLIWQRKRKASSRLRAFGELYLQTLSDGKICLCGMLASDIAALPEAVRAPLLLFFEDQELWLVQTLEAGLKANEFPTLAHARNKARSLLSALQGGMLIARARNDSDYLTQVLDEQLASICK
jgi:TetR/AcrR family transcriptional regulator, transcriptional repressor for nem operon